MIPTGKMVKIPNHTSFRIPSFWRAKMNLTRGNTVKIRIQNNSIIINVCNQYTTEITSTISGGGQIYIPTEVRNHFQLKGIECFNIFIDEVNKHIILRPIE